MAILPPLASPRALLADLRTVWQGDRRHKLVAGVVAIGMTSLIVTGFIVESWWGVLPEGERITYVTEYSAGRTDAEIVAQQKIDQRAREAFQAKKRASFRRADEALSRLGI